MDKLILMDNGAANYNLENRWLGLRHEVEVILFEPDARSNEALKELGFQVYAKALAAKEGKRVLNLTKKPQCSSFFKPNLAFLKRFPDAERWAIVDQLKIEVASLDSFGLDVDFIKLDTQGSELEILSGSLQTLKGVLGLEIEVSFLEIYQNQPLFGEVCSYLLNQGFEFFDFVTEYRYGRKELDRKGQLCFADALFLRAPESLFGFNESKIQKYKTIAKAYGKEDLIKGKL